ncbi:MAG: LysR family transcriptional regulator [Firmicutes bacterium]|nr:LysR family transcriptional regulator [Bacillota bacterium]
MDIRVLQYFLAVAREGSITSAAEQLHMTQPPLSRQLKDLEDELGTQLFIRSNRKITLTEEGQLLRRRAEEIVTLMEKTKSEIGEAYDSISGELYLGCGESRAMSLIARAVNRLHKKYPKIRINLYSGNAEDVSEKLDNGLLDFGVFIGATDLSKYDYIKLPSSDTWGMIVRKDSVFAEKESIKASDLTAQPLICSRQALNENEISGWFGCPSENLNIVATYNLIYNAAAMVEEYIGYALTLEHLIDTSWESKLCFRPLEPRIKSSHSLAWRKYQIFSGAAEKFLAALQEEIEESTNQSGK